MKLDKWRMRVRIAREQGSFSADDDDMANRWDKCAVAEFREVSGRKPREAEWYYSDSGRDTPTSRLGQEFGVAVFNNDFSQCTAVLDQLEAMLP